MLSAGQDMKELELRYTAGGNIKRYNYLDNSLILQQIAKHTLTIFPSHFISRYLLR